MILQSDNIDIISCFISFDQDLTITKLINRQIMVFSVMKEKFLR